MGDTSRTNSSNGSGLGLAICKRIVELHLGTIGLESPPGGGATFHFTLPRAHDDADRV
ncbi:MAG: ATP-binding protein [Alkalispirochaeta sp.]